MVLIRRLSKRACRLLRQPVFDGHLSGRRRFGGCELARELKEKGNRSGADRCDHSPLPSCHRHPPQRHRPEHRPGSAEERHQRHPAPNGRRARSTTRCFRSSRADDRLRRRQLSRSRPAAIRAWFRWALRRSELVGLDWKVAGSGVGFIVMDDRGLVITLLNETFRGQGHSVSRIRTRISLGTFGAVAPGTADLVILLFPSSPRPRTRLPLSS
jgi:hypothetical protein